MPVKNLRADDYTFRLDKFSPSHRTFTITIHEHKTDKLVGRAILDLKYFVDQEKKEGLGTVLRITERDLPSYIGLKVQRPSGH